MGFFERKVSMEEYESLKVKLKGADERLEELEEKFKELQRDYNSVVRENRELRNAIKEKTSDKVKVLIIYIERFLRTVVNLKKKNLLWTDDPRKFGCFEPKIFKDELSRLGDLQESLRIFRDLNLIECDKNSFTTAKNINRKSKRVIAVNKSLFNKILELYNKEV